MDPYENTTGTDTNIVILEIGLEWNTIVRSKRSRDLIEGSEESRGSL